ncbi:MAG: curlin repeat-containing protein [Paludibacter sp.]|nr:curlin repeat-containing protein [Paludibacter sp.]
MNRLNFIVGFAFMASAVLAQNNSEVVNQTGNDHTAKVVQTGFSNDATVDQCGGNCLHFNPEEGRMPNIYGVGKITGRKPDGEISHKENKKISLFPFK